VLALVGLRGEDRASRDNKASRDMAARLAQPLILDRLGVLSAKYGVPIRRHDYHIVPDGAKNRR
jgi:hypothetical protein